MPTKATSPGGMIFASARNTIVTPPGILGWNHLIEPDEFLVPSTGVIAKNFKANVHHSEEQLAALTKRLQSSAVDFLWEKFLAEAEKAGRKEWTYKEKGKMVSVPWPEVDAQDFIDNALQPFKDGSRIELPYMTWTNAADYKDGKTGAIKRKTIRATDRSGASLDLPTLRLGMGSVVQALLSSSLYSSPILDNGKPRLSLKLQGLRIITLEQYGGGGPALGEISEEDMDLISGDGVEAQDLSAYVKKAPAPEPVKASLEEEDDADLEKEMPF